MNHQERAVFEWLTGEPTPAAAAACRRALQAAPELLARLLEEVRFDHQLSRCLADETPAVGSPAVPEASAATAASAVPEATGVPGADPGMTMNADQQKIWARIVAQAWADESYKARLLAEPAAVLREEGLELPAGISVSVVESRDARAYLVLPAPPPDARSSAEHELRLAAGNDPGGWCW